MRKSGFVGGCMRGGVAACAMALGGCASAQTAPPPQLPSPQTPAAADAPLCYMIVMGTVTDRSGFQAYTAALPPLYQRFGGRYLAIQRNPSVLEGEYAHTSIVISQWPSCTAAQAFWTSQEYRELVEIRKNFGRFDVIITPGLPPPSPPAP